MTEKSVKLETRSITIEWSYFSIRGRSITVSYCTNETEQGRKTTTLLLSNPSGTLYADVGFPPIWLLAGYSFIPQEWCYYFWTNTEHWKKMVNETESKIVITSPAYVFESFDLLYGFVQEIILGYPTHQPVLNYANTICNKATRFFYCRSAF